MSRPLTPRLYKLNEIILDEINQFIFEVFDNLIPTEFEIINNIKYGDFTYDQYLFLTDNKNKYEVDFYKTKLKVNELDKLSPYFPNKSIINCVDIGFTLYDNINDDYHDNGLEGTPDDPYIKRTNKNEQYEVLGKVGYIVNNYINNHPEQKIYALGKNTHKSNLKIYVYMFKKIFSNSFEMIEDKSPYYSDGAFYFIRK